MKYNINRSLFVVLLLLLLGCISGYAKPAVPQTKSASVFTITQKTTLPTARYQWQSKLLQYSSQEPPLRKFYTPYLMQVNGELVVMASATIHPASNNQYETINFQRRKSSDNGTKWIPEYERIEPLPFNRYSKDYIPSPNEKDYYPAFVLVESNNTPTVDGTPYYFSQNAEKKYSTLRIMEVKPEKSSSKGYSMGYASVLAQFPFRHGYDEFIKFVGNTSSPILTMKSNTLVFPVQLLSRYNRSAAGVMYFKPDEKVWKLGGVVSDEGNTYNPAVIEWENEKLIMIAQHDSGYYRVYESTNLGKNWKESTSTLSRVWANSPIPPGRGTQNIFITATIDGKRVIFFTQSVETEAGNELHLWLTDNTHIYHVGLISKGQKVTTSTLLFKDDKLYCLYEAGTPEEYKVLFVDLTAVMGKIKIVLSTWTNQDTLVSKCHCYNETCASSECRIPTTGLVGYLSGNIDGDKWNDEYLCVDATVKGAKSNYEFNGLIFKGADAGAIWPVSANRLAKQYHFTNYAFTLAATVTIHEVPKKDSSPLLGVKLKDRNGQEILLGVSYTNESKWSTVKNGNEGKAEILKWEVEKNYSVILTFENGKGSVYINGTRLDVGTDLKITEKKEITHFYFGEYSEGGKGNVIVNMSVKDVMLYNRVLSNEEIDTLLRSRMNISFEDRDGEKILQDILNRPGVVKSSPLEATETPQNSTTSTPAKTTNASAPVIPESQPSPEPASRIVPEVKESPEKPQQKEKIPENKATSTKTTAPAHISNRIQEHLQNTTQSNTIRDVKARQNKTIDGTVRIYESVLPILLLGLWALATSLL
ncbi:trans-sialidase [Trypanosoma theileri]|uniref:Trans-sialidase n=1 Tax=Trypanosoma theileri TaxID=67003 RepID=A0A1X0P167_9TRYP|nr:trans-sialidase [Trypanosoma theileri]ORC90677.1 trans-sialidase [Trypanosoma theileri]